MNDRLHRTHIACIVALFVISIPLFSKAGLTPFGGQIVFIDYCNDGMLLQVNEPLKGSEWFFWQTGNLPYLMYVVPHISQYLLGQASSGSRDCYLGDDYIGNGEPIQFHGESN